MLARPPSNNIEDVLAGSSCSLCQLLDEFLGVRLLGDKLQDGTLQSIEGLGETSSGTSAQPVEKSRV